MGVQDINGADNIQILGDGNTIIQGNKKKNINLYPIKQRFRLLNIDGMFFIFCALLILLPTVFFHRFPTTYFTVPLTLILILVYLFYLPKKWPIMYISVFEDKIIDKGKEIPYSKITETHYLPRTTHFLYRTPNKASFNRAILYREDYPSFIDDAIRRYHHVHGTVLE